MHYQPLLSPSAIVSFEIHDCIHILFVIKSLFNYMQPKKRKNVIYKNMIYIIIKSDVSFAQ